MFFMRLFFHFVFILLIAKMFMMVITYLVIVASFVITADRKVFLLLVGGRVLAQI